MGTEPIARELKLGDNLLTCHNGALIIEGDPQTYETIIEHPLDKKEIRTFLELLKAEFPSVSINLYSGKNWIADHLDKWVRLEAGITGEQPMSQNVLLQVLALQSQYITKPIDNRLENHKKTTSRVVRTKNF